MYVHKDPIGAQPRPCQEEWRYADLHACTVLDPAVATGGGVEGEGVSPYVPAYSLVVGMNQLQYIQVNGVDSIQLFSHHYAGI